MTFMERVWRRMVEWLRTICRKICKEKSKRQDLTKTVSARLSPVSAVERQLAITAELSVATPGEGFTDITREAARFLADNKAGDGALFLFLRHTSASLVIQENADPDVQRDLITALRRIAPENAGWVHDTEGPDDMPAHVKTMCLGRVAAYSGCRRQNAARDLAGHLPCRAPRKAA